MADSKREDLKKLEDRKAEILKKIADRVNCDPDQGEVFGATHNSHSSSSKHNSHTSH